MLTTGISEVHRLINSQDKEIAVIVDFSDVPEWRTLSLLGSRELIRINHDNLKSLVFVGMSNTMMIKFMYMLSKQRSKRLSYSLYFLRNLQQAEALLDTLIEPAPLA